MQQRKDEIQAKKARLAELKRLREERQKEFAAGRQSLGSPLGGVSSPRRNENRQELDSLISSLVGERKPRSPAQPLPTSPTQTPRYPSLITYDGPPQSESLSAVSSPVPHKARQILSFAPLKTVYELKADSHKTEMVTYSKGVQTSQHWKSSRSASSSDSDREAEVMAERSPMRKLSRRQKEREEQLRQKIRNDVEEELKMSYLTVQTTDQTEEATEKSNDLPRILTTEELETITSSHDFMDFLDRSSKVAERALGEDYDVLVDYRYNHWNEEDDEDTSAGVKGKKGQRIKETLQFYDERWSKKRMVTDLAISSKFPELVLASYTKDPSAPSDSDGLVQIWNMHMQERPEYSLHATSDVLTAKFHPFYPNLVLGGSYSGQVMLWDVRLRSPSPVQQTSLTGAGHSHPVYSLNVVGTQNAHNIITTSTDGIMCSWATDMLSIPQQRLLLRRPIPPRIVGTSMSLTGPFANDLAVTCTVFPPSQTTYFLAGTESGSIYLCHRHDRASTPAGADQKVLYRSHAAPVMSLDFHNAAGPHNLGELLLSTGLDWGIKLWRVKAPTPAIVDRNPDEVDHIKPLLEIARDDAVYDAKWSPVKPGVFASVDGGGWLEVWDLNNDLEEPVARERTAPRGKLGATATTVVGWGSAHVGGFVNGMEGVGGGRSLNKCAWDPTEGKRIAVGGLDGVVSVFEVGSELGGAESAKLEEWDGIKRLMSRLEGGWL